METNKLTTLSLFKNLTVKEIEDLFGGLSIRETEFKKNEILAYQDEPCNRLILLIQGRVKGEMIDPSGRVAKVEDITAPSPLAILFLFGEENRFPVQVTALEDVKTLIIPKQSVIKMLSMNEKILVNYLDISANFASRLSKKLNLMSFRTIRQKLALYVLELSQKQNQDTIVLDKSRSALAEYFGVSRPSLEREITHMQNDGLIEADKREITILDRQSLIRIIRL